MKALISNLADRVMSGHDLSRAEALSLFETDRGHVPYLMGCAVLIRNHFLGDAASLCAIVNAKSGNCPEDCAFCSQSNHNRAEAPVFPLASAKEILAAAGRAREMKASCFGIVTSGRVVNTDKEIAVLARAISLVRSAHPGMDLAVSIGPISTTRVRRLMDAGLTTVHHNIETSENHFPRICTTHSYKDKIDFIETLRGENVKICSGVLLGMGEARADRVDAALALRSLGVESVPINFLNPIPGTPLERTVPEPPIELLRSIAVFRFLLPRAKIRVCGGRERTLGSLQAGIFLAGASGMMTGNYLTTPGQDPLLDRRMLEDLRMEIS